MVDTDTQAEEGASNKIEKKEAAKGNPPASGDQYAYLRSGFVVDLSKELPQYSSPHAKAYVAGKDRTNPDGYFAVINDPSYSPRTNIVKSYQLLTNKLIPTVESYGTVKMPRGQPNSYGFVYARTLGNRLYESDHDVALGWSAENTLEKIVIPIVACLKELEQRDISHGNLRMTNLYDGGKPDYKEVKLGDCLSCPPSLNQPVIYEPVERAMADPLGRGPGTSKDDLYSLGVIIAMHLRGYDPMRGKTDDEIISSKIVNGSYATLIGSDDRFSGGLSELIRGLLTDDPRGRWGMEEIDTWLDGRRLSQKQTVKIKKASRSISFDGRNFHYARTLAHQMIKKPQEAMELLQGNDLIHWVERSLMDNEMLERLNNAFRIAADGGEIGFADRLLPRVSIALDPKAPIRYRKLSFHLGALGDVMAYTYMNNGKLNVFQDLFQSGILYDWMATATDLNIDISVDLQNYEKCRLFLRQRGITNGLERCLYFLNGSVHCLSPLISEYFVRTPEDYVLALEDLASQKNAGGSLPDHVIDKHAACFLAARDSKIIEPYAYDLSSDEEFRQILATLQILSVIQKSGGIGELPHLTAWICSNIKPLVERFHDTETQDAVKKEIEIIRKKGQLTDLLDIFENPKRVRKDQTAFRKALRDYRKLEIEAADLAVKLENPRFNAEKTGREWAATISCIIAALIIIGSVIAFYGSKGPV